MRLPDRVLLSSGRSSGLYSVDSVETFGCPAVYLAACMHISLSVCLRLVNSNSGITLASYMMVRFSSQLDQRSAELRGHVLVGLS
jgi:hypothetical protein